MARVELHSYLIVLSDYRRYILSEESSALYLQDWERVSQEKEQLRTDPEAQIHLRRQFEEKWQLKQDDALPVDLQYAFPDPWVKMPDGSYEQPSKEWREKYLNKCLIYRIENGGDSRYPELNTPTNSYIYNLLNFHFERQASSNLKDRFVRYVHNLVQEHLNERLEQAKNTNGDDVSWLRVASQWDPRKSAIKKSNKGPDTQLPMPNSKQVALLLDFLSNNGHMKIGYAKLLTLIAILTGTDRESIVRYFNAPTSGHEHSIYTKRNIEWGIRMLSLLELDTVENEQWLRSKSKSEEDMTNKRQ